MRDLVIRAAVAALLLLGIAAFTIDWQQLFLPGGASRTLDAMIQGNPTQLKAQVAGYLAAVTVTDYGVVRRGDPLFVIDDRDDRARVDRARAEVDEAEAELDVARAQLAQQFTQIAVAQAQIASADAGHIQAAQQKSRQAALRHTESFLARDWQNAVAADAGATAAQEGARGALTAARMQVSVLQAQLESREASLQGQRAALRLALVQLGYTRVTAPFDAVATARLVRQGDYVTDGAALITLVPLQGAWVVGYFRERQLTHMQVGQHARITVDAIPAIVFTGHLDSVAATSQAVDTPLPPDRAVGNFTKIVQRIAVKIVLDASPAYAAQLRPGLSAEVSVDSHGTAQ